MTIESSIVIWTFRWSSYLLNSLLSLSQKVRLNHFLSRSHEDFPHTSISFPFQLADFCSIALLLNNLCFCSCEIFDKTCCSGVFSCCLKVAITSSSSEVSLFYSFLLSSFARMFVSMKGFCISFIMAQRYICAFSKRFYLIF